MADKEHESPKIKILEPLVIEVCDYSYTAATVQRNDHLPLNLLAHIENTARIGGVPRGCGDQITKM